MKILAAIDNSSSTGAVLKAIPAQAQPQKTSLGVLHVLQPVSSAVPPQMSPGYAPELEPFAKPTKELLAVATASCGYHARESGHAVAGRPPWFHDPARR
jgi:hypothetical protein